MNSSDNYLIDLHPHLVDVHCHILPCMDDGSSSKEESLELISMEKSQGVDRIVLTPHFYAHREHSVASFLKKRQRTFDEIKDESPIKNMHLAAEVAIESEISELPDIEKLAIEGTNLILLELPYRPFENWMAEEIYNISMKYGLEVILAHPHRYCDTYTDSQMEQVLSLCSYWQINNEAFGNWKEARFVKKLMKRDVTKIIFGTDCHNTIARKPNWDLLKKKCKPEIIHGAMETIEKLLLTNNGQV